MSETMKVIIDDKMFQEELKNMTNQIPFAMATGINNLAKAVQTANIENMKKEFTIRKQPFLKYSNKISQFAKKDELTAIVGISPVGDNAESVFTKFQDGGDKTPFKGGNIAVPNRDDMGISINRLIPDRLKPRNLPTATTFKYQASTGKSYLFGIVGRGKRREFKLLYILVPQVKIPPKLNYYSTAETTIIRNYEVVMSAAIQRAIDTAK